MSSARLPVFCALIALAVSLIPSPAMASESANVSIPILMYHRVDDVAVDEYWVSRDEFEGQMKALVAYGYEPVSTANVYDYLFDDGILPAKPVIITFDDGYQNIYTHAYPILMQEGLFCETFIVTGVTEWMKSRRMRTSWNGIGIAANPHLVWPEIIEMAENGMVFGSHTETHRDLTTLTEAEIELEIANSKQALFLEAGIEATSFSYPLGAGDDDPLIHQILVSNGYNTAVSAWRGICQTSEADPLDLKRVYIYGPHPVSDPDSNGVSVNYDPDRPFDFFMSQIDPEFSVPAITVESVEFLDKNSYPRDDNAFYPGEVVILRITAQNDGDGAEVIMSAEIDSNGGGESQGAEIEKAYSPDNISTYFAPTSGSPETFEFSWQVPLDAPAGLYGYDVEILDPSLVLKYASTGWVEDSLIICEEVHLIEPSNGVFIHEPPVFSWDSACSDYFLVEFAYDSNFTHILGRTPILSLPSFSVPAQAWTRLPKYKPIYWRVWSADIGPTPARIKAGEEVRSFRKH